MQYHINKYCKPCKDEAGNGVQNRQLEETKQTFF